MSDSYEELKQKNLSEEGREKINNGGFFEITVLIDWTTPEFTDSYLTIDFVLDESIEDEFFSDIDFDSENFEERDDMIASALGHSLGEMIERGLILDAYGNKHISSVDELDEHVKDFRVISV